MARRRRTRDDRMLAWVIAGAAGFVLGALAMGLVTIEPRATAGVFESDAEAIARRETERPVEAGELPGIDDPAVGPPPGVVQPVIEAAGPAERRWRLTVPVRDISPQALVSSFDDRRGADRRHEAIDILAPRHTPVVAAVDGRIAKLFTSDAGGLTIYEYGPDERYVYYYAHLERYADGLAEGDAVRAGEVIGFVGTSGNAPADVPHLHFAIMRMSASGRWWDGEAVDPYPLLRGTAGG